MNWDMLNLAMTVAAIYALGRHRDGHLRAVADVLMFNWALGIAMWCFGSAVPLPLWIGNDLLAAALLILKVPGRAALAGGVAFVVIVASNIGLLLIDAEPDLFINVAGWLQLALIWGVGTHGASGGMGVRFRGGDFGRHAYRRGVAALSKRKAET